MTGAVLATLRLAVAAALLATATAASSQDGGGAAPELDFGAVDPQDIVGAPRGEELTGAELAAATEELAEKLRCPVCQGLSVADSPSSSALSMLDQIYKLFAAGYERQQIIDYFTHSYGEFVLLSPPAKGFNWLLWLAPAAGLLLGAVVLALRFQRSRSDTAEVEPPSGGTPAADPYLERVRRETAGS